MKTKLTSFIVMLLMVLAMAAVVQAAPAGKVTNLEGRADVTAPGQPAKPLLIGEAINVGDIIRTKNAAKCEVTWVDGSIARLAANSRLQVTAFNLQKTSRKTILSLFRGKVQHVVISTAKLFGAKGDSQYEVYTPTSVCGVRGTTFFTSHENGVSGSLFADGSGYMYSRGLPGQRKSIFPGVWMYVSNAKTPPRSRHSTPGELNKFLQETTLSGKKKDSGKSEDEKGITVAGGGGSTGTTMLGGDPMDPTQDSPEVGGSGGTVVTTDVTGPVPDPLVPPVAPVNPPPTDTTTFSLPVVAEGVFDGTLKGTISNTTNTGTINLTGAGTESNYVLSTAGALSDGSTANTYLTGISGSWRGLFTGLSRKDTSVSILKGDLSGAYADAVGNIVRSTGYTVAPESSYQSFTDLPLLVLQNLTISGEAFSDPVVNGPYDESGIKTDGVTGYNTQSGGILGIWGVNAQGGTYVNTTGETSKNIPLYHFSYGSSTLADHFAFGTITVTDDLQGHTTVSGVDSLAYLDRQYIGKLSLDYRGVYNELQEYDAVGTGVYKLDPLSWSGDWGGSTGAFYGPVSLYGNSYDSENAKSMMELVAHDMGLAGGTTPFWSQTSHLVAKGYVADDDLNPVSGETVAGPLLWNSGIGAQALTGSTVGEVFTPDAEFTGVTAGIWQDGLMNGSAYAIYKTAAGQAGWLKGIDTISGSYDSDLGIWQAGGDLTPTQRIAQLPAGVTSNDLDVFHDIAIGMLGGNFANGVGNIQNQSSIMQTTFYGKGLYDEDGYLNEVIPLRWGIYDVRMSDGNSFTGKPVGATSWTSKIGGYGPTQMQAPFFYLADITGNWQTDGTIDGQLSGKYMTPLYLGVLAGPFYGLYTEETTGAGGWIGQSVGTYNVTQKLAHSATWGEDLYVWYSGDGGLFTDAGGQNYHAGYVRGLLGGTTAPWIGASDFQAMGLFQIVAESNLVRATYLWNDRIQGKVPRDITETASAGGNYIGYSSAFWRRAGYSGAIRAIYLTPPDATTGKSAAGFLGGDGITGSAYTQIEITDDGYNYSAGLWESMGTNTLTASDPVVSGLDPANITPVYGEMNAAFVGTFGGAGTLTNDAAWGSFNFFMNGSDALPFGIYNLQLGGETGGVFSGLPAGTTTWSAKLGGGLNIGGDPALGVLAGNNSALAVNAGNNYEYGYWLADGGGQWNASGEITGDVTNGKYLTATQMGTLSGPFYGLYTELGADETGSFGTWIGQSIGNYQGAPLAFGGQTHGSLMYHDSGDGSYLSSGGYASGLLGGTEPTLFSGSNTSVLMMGNYDSDDNTKPYLMYGSGWYSSGSASAISGGSEGGSFDGYLVGLWANGSIKARMLSLYRTEAGATGYLESVGDEAFNLAGKYYSGIGMWEIPDGTLKATPSGDTISSPDIAYHYFDGNQGSGAFNVPGGGTLTVTVAAGDPMRFSELGWGIWNAGFGGFYNGTTDKDWSLELGGNFRTAQSDYTENGYWLGKIAGTAWGATEIGGAFLGNALTNLAWYELTGDIIGSPIGTGVWQAAGIGKYQVDPLAYSASVYSGNWGYYNTTPDSEGLVNDGGSITGLIGGFSPLFGGNADVIGLGTYTRNPNSPLFNMLLTNADGGPETNPFHVYYGGSWFPAGIDHPEWFEGKMMGFYARNWDDVGKKYNEIGLITSGPLIDEFGEDSGFSVWGDLYSNAGMWKISADEDQGTLTHLAKPGTAASFLIAESDWSPAAKVEGDFQGTMRMKSATLDGIDTWGIWMSAMGGTYTETIPERWAGRIGGMETNTYGKQYFLATLDGYSYSDGAIWGGVNGRFLNPKNTGVFTGDMIGVSASGNWQALGIGSYEVTPLAFVSDMSAGITHAARAYEGQFSYSAHGGSYSYNYYSDNSVGYSYHQPTSDSSSYTETYYYGDGTKSVNVCDAGVCNPSSGTWDTTQSLSFLKTPTPPAGETASPVYAYDNFTVNQSGAMNGLLGGTESLWYEADGATINPTKSNIPFTALGQFGNLRDSIWHTDDNLYSYNYRNSTYTTYDGGAYVGIMGGTEINNSVDGRFLALYIAPGGSAGYLKGPLLSGTLYPGTWMFELDGVLNRAQVSDNTGVVPENLYNSVWNGSMSASLGGRFTGVGGGEINSYSEYGEYAGNGGNGGAAVSISIGDSVYDRGYGGGTTLSIINNETHVAQNWGIYGFELYGEFTNAKPDWTAKVGGSGSFGAYYDGNGGYFANDDGFWLADASGTLDGTGKLTGALANGKFITYTRLGTLGGDLLGSLDAAYNVWEAVSLGTYEGTPLAFVSNIYYSGETGWLEMLLGGTDSLWTGTDIPVMGLGNVNGGSGLASGSLYSYNYKNDTNTTYDSSPGAYRGFYSLAGNANNGVDGSLIALYVDNNGKVGVLGGPLTGHINTNAMLEVNGTLNRFGLGDVPEGLIPANFTSNIGEATTGYSLADSDSSTIGFNFLQEDQAWISSLPQPTWGIWQARMEGASVPDNSIWTSSQSWYWQTTSSSDGSMTRWYNFDAQGDSATGALSGAVAGAAVDWVNAKTAVLGADIKGLFDPTAATWKAISNGTSMETAAFVNLVNTFATDAEKNAFMAAMKIPAINVGQATLTQGVGTVNNLSNVAMNNVTFFATSTGAAPKIWATNDVSGNYAAAPSLTGPSVNLSGNGLNATFNVNYWDGANWGARVAGSGTLSGGSYTGAVEFKGGAAGKIDQPAAGSFSGTGAGVAK